MKTFLEDALQIHLEDVLKTSSRRLLKIVTLKMSSRRLEDVLGNRKCLLGVNQKLFYNCEYMRDFEKISILKKQLPIKENFYSSVTGKKISGKE